MENLKSKLPAQLVIRALGSATNASTATTVGGDFEMPFTGVLTGIGAYVDTAGVTGTAVFDVHKNGTTVMTTSKITIDTTEKTSRTAVTAPVITTTALAEGDIITIDIDTAQTTPAIGLSVWLEISRLS